MSDIAGLETERSKPLRAAIVTARCPPFMGASPKIPATGRRPPRWRRTASGARHGCS